MKLQVVLLALTIISVAPPSLADPPPFPNGIDRVPARPPVPAWPEGVDVVEHAIPIRRPTARDMERIYPESAIASEINGRVVLRCQFGNAGAFTRCGVAAEAPLNKNFGAAAMKVAPIFLYELNDADGKPLAGRAMDVDILFRLN